MRGDSHCGVLTGRSPLPETALNGHLCPSGGSLNGMSWVWATEVVVVFRAWSVDSTNQSVAQVSELWMAFRVSETWGERGNRALQKHTHLPIYTLP